MKELVCFVFFWFSVLVRFVVVVVVAIGGVEEFVDYSVVCCLLLLLYKKSWFLRGLKKQTEKVFVKVFFFSFNGSRNCWWSFS